MKIVRKAEELMSSCGEIVLASVNEHGYPRICVLSKIKSEGINKVYVATGMTGTKTGHFQANPKASVCAWKDGNSITLIGTVKVTRERAVLEEMWLDWFIEHFPGGIDDPNYCILEFSSEEATLWIDGEFVTVAAADLR
ncbi:MAG: pyridoxamine 5'-phosphate oxidase family protein [Clostridia bacterium]|nr:pyridoxamine 5'-phosphate oxidase family protein [Clostridia bacterium]